jgi:hypothetical protein
VQYIKSYIVQWKISGYNSCDEVNIDRVTRFYKNLNKVIQFKMYGIQYESVAKEIFEAITNLKIMPCGIFVGQCLNFLAGSPDGIILIKCPSIIKNTTPQEAANMKNH